MDIEQIIGNDIIGIKKIISKESKTITYSLTIFPIMIDTTIGKGWYYNEISIAIIPIMRFSIYGPLHD